MIGQGRVLSYAAAGLGIQLTWAVMLAFMPAPLEPQGALPFHIGAVMAADPLTPPAACSPLPRRTGRPRIFVPPFACVLMTETVF